MDKLEVDPKLFITCRLCLEEMGLYQIVPKVKIQIKYCFDIEVDPFDGLPQLICRKCESILSQYVVIKQKFQEKQNTLKSNISVKKAELNCEDQTEAIETKKETDIIPQETVTSTSNQHTEDMNIQAIESDEDRPALKYDTDMEENNINSHIEDNINSDIEDRATPKKLMVRIKTWKADYKKYFVCRFCSKKDVEKKNIIKHIKKHNKLLTFYNKNISKHCTVKLDKCDQKSNVTGSKKMVVYSKNKIIYQNKNANYYVLYLQKGSHYLNDKNDSSSSSETEIIQCSRIRKRRRIQSRSSSDTIKIDESSGIRNEKSDDFIEVSDTETVESKRMEEEEEESQMETSAHAAPIKKDRMNIDTVIKSIIETSQKRYLNKLESSTDASRTRTNKESQIQHKLLSIGCKVLNNKEFNSVGLLRYLEHKNLDVVCVPRLMSKGFSKDTKHVKIKTRLKEKKENNNKNSGWSPISSVLSEVDKGQDFSEIFKKILIWEPKNQEDPSVSASCSKQEQAVLSMATISDLEKQKKLLNANPVANPKQLPKKTNTETKANYKEPMEAEDHVHNMPIITSTVSLAPEVKEKPAQPDPSADVTQKPPVVYGCIKVKPDSVLMANNNTNNGICLLGGVPPGPSDQAPTNNWKSLSLSNILQNTNNLNFGNTEGLSNSNMVKFTNIAPKLPPQVQNYCNPHQALPIVTENMQTNQVNGNSSLYSQAPGQVPAKLLQPVQVFSGNSKPFSNETKSMQPMLPTLSGAVNQNQSADKNVVVLHTVELPNTKTKSPLAYFKQLLHMHNISLLQGSDRPRTLHLLIKFKLLFQQDPVPPITLSLALYGDMSIFIFEVTESANNKKIEISQLTANWQWEILKVFAGTSIVDKILANAQKINSAMFQKTKMFVNLLRSIQLGETQS